MQHIDIIEIRIIRGFEYFVPERKDGVFEILPQNGRPKSIDCQISRQTAGGQRCYERFRSVQGFVK